MHRARGRPSRSQTHAAPRQPRWAPAAAIGVGLAFALSLSGCPSARPQRPDLVLITIGAFDVESLSCFGGPAELGADLCSVGELGSRFVWAFSTAGTPAPAVASLLTGLAPEAHGVTRSAASFLGNGHTTLAEHLARAGYTTAAFVTDPALNRSRHFDQGFELFDDGGIASALDAPPAARSEAPARAAQWLAGAPSPFLAWVHLDPAADDGAPPDQALRQLDRTVSRLLAVLEARPTPPALLVTGLPPRDGTGLEPAQTRVALLWRTPRVGGGQGVTRVIRTPVSQLDVAPTLLRATGLIDAAAGLPGQPLPFRERRSDEPDRTLEISGGRYQALIGEGVYLVLDDAGAPAGVAQLPLAGQHAPKLGGPEGSEELAARLWEDPSKP